MRKLMMLLLLLSLYISLQGCAGNSPTGPLLDSAAVLPQQANPEAQEVKKTPTLAPTPTGTATAAPTATAIPTATSAPSTPTPGTPVNFQIISPPPCVLFARGTGAVTFIFMAGSSYYSVEGAIVHYLDVQYQEVGVLGLGDFPAGRGWWTATVPWDGSAAFLQLSGSVGGMEYLSETCAGVGW